MPPAAGSLSRQRFVRFGEPEHTDAVLANKPRTRSLPRCDLKPTLLPAKPVGSNQRHLLVQQPLLNHRCLKEAAGQQIAVSRRHLFLGAVKGTMSIANGHILTYYAQNGSMT